MKRIAFGTWALVLGPYAEKPVPLTDVVARLVELGFDGLELGGFTPHPTPDSLPEKSQRHELAASIREAGLELCGYAPDLWQQHLLDTADPTAYLNAFKKNVDFCHDMGIPQIRVDTVHPPTLFGSVNKGTARGRLTHAWFTCCDYAAHHGIRVAWEFEPGFAFNKATDIVRIVEGVNHDCFTVLFDTAHAQMVASGARHDHDPEVLEEGAIELARMLRGRIGHIHLSDSDGTLNEDETSTHVTFGAGTVPFEPLLAELSLSGAADAWWCIDLCNHPDAWTAMEGAKSKVDALNRRFGDGFLI